MKEIHGVQSIVTKATDNDDSVIFWPHRIVSHITGSGAQVYDGSSGGTAVSEGVHVSHDVMPQLPLLLRSHDEINVLQVRLHLAHLGIGDGETQSLQRRH